MPEYSLAAAAAVAAVVALDLVIVRTRLLGRLDYWLTIAIVLFFQVLVDGWLTKHSAPIVLYRDTATTGLRPVWDIPIEDFFFGFALVTLVLVMWQRQARA